MPDVPAPQRPMPSLSVILPAICKLGTGFVTVIEYLPVTSDGSEAVSVIRLFPNASEIVAPQVWWQCYGTKK